MSFNSRTSPWICCQLGAREHYSIPRALHQSGVEMQLITDTWVPPKSLLGRLNFKGLARLRERFHIELSDASVHSFTAGLIGFELSRQLMKGQNPWDQIISRNNWFQAQVVRQLQMLTSTSKFDKRIPILFTYSYSALSMLLYAKDQGWKTVLGQIDPGPVEEQLVLEEHYKHPSYLTNWRPAPSSYWQNWHRECVLADHIIVNSSWSRDALQKAGIPSKKIQVFPLVYKASKEAKNFKRTYPVKFSSSRPLRVLFLGQIILRKGILAILDAAMLLKHQPIEFWMVGSNELLKFGDEYEYAFDNLHWLGIVSRSETNNYYQQADIFLFPTLSDGFGLTQLEAQAWQLPLIVSKRCGKVVQDQLNGIVLEKVSGQEIANHLLICLENPALLHKWSNNSIQNDRFSLNHLSHRLQSL